MVEIGTSGNVVPQYLRDSSPRTYYIDTAKAQYAIPLRSGSGASIHPIGGRIPRLVAEPEFLANIVLKTLQPVTIPVGVEVVNGAEANSR